MRSVLSTLEKLEPQLLGEEVRRNKERRNNGREGRRKERERKREGGREGQSRLKQSFIIHE